MDILKVDGLGRVSGEYECDVAGLVDISSDEALTVREAQFVRDFSGARGGEIVEGFIAGDMSVRSALAMVILRRKGKPLRDETVLDLPSGWARFELGVEDEQDTDNAVPPTTEGVTPSTDGGPSSQTLSETPAGVPSPIGALV